MKRAYRSDAPPAKPRAASAVKHLPRPPQSEVLLERSRALRIATSIAQGKLITFAEAKLLAKVALSPNAPLWAKQSYQRFSGAVRSS